MHQDPRTDRDDYGTFRLICTVNWTNTLHYLFDGRAGVIHGVAQFQAGCRCRECCSSESARLQQIARTERVKWELINRDAMAGWGKKRRSRRASPTPVNNGAPWEYAEIVVALDQSISTREAANRLGRTVAAVKNVRRRKRI